MGVRVLDRWRRLTPAGGDLDMQEHRWALESPLPPGAVLEFQGLATWSDILIDGQLVASHRTMFRPLFVTVPPSGGSSVEIRVLPLVPGKAARRPRWRNRLVPGEGLRTVRTALLGRVPGTGTPAVGPFRPVLLHAAAPVHTTVRARMDGNDGIVEIRVLGAAEGRVAVAGHSAALVRDGDALVGRLRLHAPPLWWPHTHGAPALLDVSATLDGRDVALGRTGFRTIARVPGEGFGLVVNGVPVFCRGALWMGGGELARARDAGMNMIRVPGSTTYPDRAFFDSCDALGLLVWQDFMFARFDYPDDDAFLAECRAEADGFLVQTAAHPCLAVLCGGDETIQAAAMAGRPPAEWSHPLFDTVLAQAAAAGRPDIPYVPNAPSGGALPVAASAPVAHAFGIGAYQRPLSEAARVRFAAACLAFSNPPDPAGCRALCTAPGDAAWAAAVPRDPGASWTFEDARDHYVRSLFGLDPAELRRTQPEWWLALGRAAVALAMQAAVATWRTNPACHGALVLALQDIVPGPGWGVLAHDGRPKSALHALAQVFRPVQVLLRDEALDGVVVHLLNETADPRTVRLVLRGLTPAGAVDVLADAERTLPPRSRAALPAAALMGRFQDLAGAWRFAPPPYAVLGASAADTTGTLSEATLFPQGPAMPSSDVGLAAALSGNVLTIEARRFAQFVTIDDEGCVPDDDHVHLWPGEPRHIRLTGARPQGSVSALNTSEVVHYR